MASLRLLGWAVFMLAVFFGPEWLSAVQAQANTWETYRSQKFGYSLVFPADIVQLRSESTDGRGIEFTSDDGLVKLKVLADHNAQNVSLGDYRGAILREFSESNQLEYGPMGRSWFVLSGVRGDSIYYQKVLFCLRGANNQCLCIDIPGSAKARV